MHRPTNPVIPCQGIIPQVNIANLFRDNRVKLFIDALFMGPKRLETIGNRLNKCMVVPYSEMLLSFLKE